MIGASDSLENKQESLTSSRQTEKNAFSELSSEDLLRNRKCFSDPAESNSGFVDGISSKQSSEHCLPSCAKGDGAQSKQYTCFQNNIISIVNIVIAIVIKLLMLLDVVVTGILAAVGKPSSDFREVISHSQSSVGSLGSTTSKYPAECSYQIVRVTGSQIFEVTPVEEVEVNIADCFYDEQVVIADVSLKSVNSTKEIGCHREVNNKQLHSQVEFTSFLDDVGCVSGLAKIAQAITGSSLSKDKPDSIPVVTEVPNILTSAVDSICFPFPADSSMISINIENYELQCLVDTGVAITAVNAFVWNKYLRQAYPSLDNYDSGDISSVNGNLLNSLGKTTMRFIIQSELFPF